MLPALVLTAGLATRLRPLSLVRAKAALPVAGVPLVTRVIRWLRSHGVRDIVLNLHHRPESITRTIGDGSQEGVRVRYSWEDPVLGSAGGPRHALPLLESSRFFIVNGDTLTDVDLSAMLGAHGRSGALVTMALIPNPRPDRYGGVRLDEGYVSGFTRRGAAEPNFHFVGVQVAERDAFERLPDNVPAESVGGLYPGLMAERRGAVAGYVSDAGFDDVGTPADYFATVQRVAAREGLGDLHAGERCAIDPAARLARCILWDDVRVAAAADLTECIVTDAVRVTTPVSLMRHILLRAGDHFEAVPF